MRPNRTPTRPTTHPSDPFGAIRVRRWLSETSSSSSPAAPEESSLLAFNADSGEPTWQADAGRHSYSSPQLVTLDTVEQVLFLSNDELTSVDPDTGEVLWRFDSEYKGYFPSTQPHVIGPSDLLIAFTESAGTMRLKVKRQGDEWNVEDVWNGGTQALKALLQRLRHLRRFHLRLRRHDLLLRRSRNWQAPLERRPLRRRPSADARRPGRARRHHRKRRGRSRRRRIPRSTTSSASSRRSEGKTWNHPTIVDDRLYVRNAEEIACYELKPL